MNAELIIRLLPTALFLGIMVWVLWRSRNSYRLQEDSVARQKDMTPRLLESIELQREGLAVGQKQLETLQALVEEIRAWRADGKNK